MSATHALDDRGVPRRRITCGSCQLLRINGMVCHETGCPEAWKTYKMKCKCCGNLFKARSHEDFRFRDICYRKGCEREWWGT